MKSIKVIVMMLLLAFVTNGLHAQDAPVKPEKKKKEKKSEGR